MHFHTTDIDLVAYCLEGFFWGTMSILLLKQSKVNPGALFRYTSYVFAIQDTKNMPAVKEKISFSMLSVYYMFYLWLRLFRSRCNDHNGM